MSADNRICIMEWQGEWHVWDGSCSCDYYEPPYSERDSFPTREAALSRAYEIANNTYILEGGITIIDIEEQERALRQDIKHLQERLDRLIKDGKQYNYDVL